MLEINDIRNIFKDKLDNQDFVTVDLYHDGKKIPTKTIEIIGTSFICNEDTIFKKVSKNYAERELEWYKSMSLNVYDIPGFIPPTWRSVCDKDGFINSNYGWCIYSEENNNQYRNCLQQLLKDQNSRRACMIYTRPSMQYEYHKNGMSDFMCTFSTQQLIRSNKLVYLVFMRSNDVINGFRNDLFWHKHVAHQLIKDLQANHIQIEDEPEIIWCAGSLHMYENDFPEIDKWFIQSPEGTL